MKVTLADSKPKIWRRICVPLVSRLGALHDAIQISMGWENSHLHCFRIGKEEYAVHYDGDPDPLGLDADAVVLWELGMKDRGFKFTYEYDFGDGWTHEIEIEKTQKMGPTRFYPYCEKAVRACPPEDCGGIPGYARLLRILKNPNHSEYEDMLDWLGLDNFDPKEVDLENINATLRQYFST